MTSQHPPHLQVHVLLFRKNMRCYYTTSSIVNTVLAPVAAVPQLACQFLEAQDTTSSQADVLSSQQYHNTQQPS
jgi:hypothetical protein